MPLTETTFKMSSTWSLEKTNTGSSSTTHASSESFSPTISVVTYTQIFLEQYTIAAAGSQTVDFYSFTNRVGEAVTATKILGFMAKATGNTGQLKIEAGASNPLTWFLSGTTPAITLECGANGCGIMLLDGIAETVDATHRNVKFSNPGAATITLSLYAILGTA